MFDPVNLGRGKLGALAENNFEFGAWDPVDAAGKGDGGLKRPTSKQPQSSVAPVAEARSGQSFEDYFPLITAAAANAAAHPHPPPQPASQKAPSPAAAAAGATLNGELQVAEPRSGELVLEQNREERDCEWSWILNEMFCF